MPYIEANAQGPSRTIVQAFWQSTGIYPAKVTSRVLPDACVDYLFDLADPTRATRDCAAIIGTMTRAIVVSTSGRRDLFGIRFRPGAVSLLWPLPTRELCDERATPDDVVPDGSRLADLLSSTSSFRERIAITEKWIEKRFASVDVDRTKLEALVTSGHVILVRHYVLGGGITEDNLKLNIVIFLKAPQMFIQHINEQTTATLDRPGAMKPVAAQAATPASSLNFQTTIVDGFDIAKWHESANRPRRRLP